MTNQDEKKRKRGRWRWTDWYFRASERSISRKLGAKGRNMKETNLQIRKSERTQRGSEKIDTEAPLMRLCLTSLSSSSIPSRRRWSDPDSCQGPLELFPCLPARCKAMPLTQEKRASFDLAIFSITRWPVRKLEETGTKKHTSTDVRVREERDRKNNINYWVWTIL